MKEPQFNKILDIVRKKLHEDMPTNNVGSGNIAGTVEAGDDPPVRLKKMKKYIYMKGVRKTWKQDSNG